VTTGNPSPYHLIACGNGDIGGRETVSWAPHRHIGAGSETGKRAVENCHTCTQERHFEQTTYHIHNTSLSLFVVCQMTVARWIGANRAGRKRFE
jgi:hypothetical protein